MSAANHKPTGDFFKCLVLFNQQFKTQIYSVFNDKTKKSSKSKCKERVLGIFHLYCLKNSSFVHQLIKLCCMQIRS